MESRFRHRDDRNKQQTLYVKEVKSQLYKILYFLQKNMKKLFLFLVLGAFYMMLGATFAHQPRITRDQT
jgi:hypothetical protein